MSSFSPEEKLAIIKEALGRSSSVYSVCKKYGISKVTFYNWLGKYQAARRNKLEALKTATLSGTDHPRSIDSKSRQRILAYVHKNPDHSCHRVAKNLNIGHHAAQNFLEKNCLNRADLRIEFSNKPFWKRETADRREAMFDLASQGWKVKEVCRHFNVSKPTYYKWKARLNAASQGKEKEALSDKFAKGENHHNYVGKDIENKVLDIVRSSPTLSVHSLHRHLAGEVGHHAIQNILLRNNLNTFSKRAAWAGFWQEGEKAQIAPLYIPDTPLYKWRLIFAPFKTVPKLIFQNPKKGFLLFFLYLFPIFAFSLWFRFVVFAQGEFRVGVIFASAALLFGLFFLAYSIKYYVTILLILKFAQGGALGASGSSKSPLRLNLEKVDLRLRPYVSIHVALYNERRVVARLLQACISQDWESANYEVILCDDSTDETLEIALEFLRENWGELATVRQSDGTQIYRTPPVPGKTSVTLIHRSRRLGFKGGALQAALEHTDRRAEYVLVFDADFVPYPDTVSQFMKSFQEICQGLENVRASNLAAVQGYQWHVLNKSETWVTRGVRTEYAGSYVIERAGEELYGGLKQISGSVYAIRADILFKFGWGKSITEDFELTLRLYEAGFKVAFCPYIQAPAEAVSTIRRLIRQRMRWAEGASYNVRLMFGRLLGSPKMSKVEKWEFLYLAPYYLQAAFFVIGTFSWFFSEVVLGTRLPFWTAAFGWSLVFTNMLSLPLMNIVGLFLEESDERDYVGVVSFVLLSYILVPFQAYAAVKGFLEREEGPWFRTPKTGVVTDVFDRSHFGRFFGNLFGGEKASVAEAGVSAFSLNPNFSGLNANFASVNNNYSAAKRRLPYLGKLLIVILLIGAFTINWYALSIPTVFAFGADKTFSTNTTINATKTGAAAGTSGNATLTVTSTGGFAAGDQVLIVQMTGTGQGNYEERTIKTVDSSTQVTLTATKTNTYTNDASSKAQMIKAEVNNSVTVNGGVIITASAWNGTTGGVLYYIANTFTVNSTGVVDMNGTGFAGAGNVVGGSGGSGASSGTGGDGNSAASGSSGSGPGGGGGGSGAGGGGQGGSGSSTCGAGGGGAGGSSGGGAGGAYGAAGTAGGNGGSGSGGDGGKPGVCTPFSAGGAGAVGAGGTAGSAYGNADFSGTTCNSGTGCLFLGSGGGSGGSGSGGGGGGAQGTSSGGNGSRGGQGGQGSGGGGIVYISANTISNSGTIRANGSAGEGGFASGTGSTGTAGGGGAGASAAGGGGGSGGAVWVSAASSMTLGTATASGGSGGAGRSTGVDGGACGSATSDGGGGGGFAGGLGGSTSCTNAGATAATGTTGAGSAGGDGRIKCDNASANCTGGSPAVGSTEVATAPVPEYALLGLPVVFFLPKLARKIRRIKLFKLKKVCGV